MKLTQCLDGNRRTLSFEVFPPKTNTAFESVRAATEEIAKLHPAFMSVTYGAGGGTSLYTMRMAQGIEARYGVPTVAHLTCVNATRETVRERIADLKERGIRNVMALRGDLPSDMRNAGCCTGPYRHAADLIRDIRASGTDFCVGGACYPETHPESPSPQEDIAHLREKVDTGCDFLTTQMFFENALFLDFLSRARAAGIAVPVLPGVMPVTAASQVERVVKLSGAYLPPRFLQMTRRWADSPEDMRRAGVAYAAEQIADLFANGVRHVHVYSMNKPDVARDIAHSLSGLLGPV